MSDSNLMQKFGVKAIAILDFETTGLNPSKDYPTEIAIHKIGFTYLNGVYEEKLESKIKLPEGIEVPEFITELTGLTTEEVNSKGKAIIDLVPRVYDLIDGDTLVIAHNANFDLGFLKEHFHIEPAHFMCTRAIEILTAPDLNASLKNVYARYFPESDKEQAHRAGGDVQMTLEVFNEQIAVHGFDEMMFFKNKMVIMPDRGLVYTPHNAKVLDFTKKYVSSDTVEKLEKQIEDMEEDVEFLSCLRGAGVDNWSGYSDAQEMMNGEDE